MTKNYKGVFMEASDNKDVIDENQTIWITAEKIVIILISILLLIMSFNNIYFYLIKAGKYKIVANTFLYVIAVITIILSTLFAIMSPNLDKCDAIYNFTYFGLSYCNQMLGIIQACILTTLCCQLKTLFTLSNQLKLVDRATEGQRDV